MKTKSLASTLTTEISKPVAKPHPLVKRLAAALREQQPRWPGGPIYPEGTYATFDLRIVHKSTIPRLLAFWVQLVSTAEARGIPFIEAESQRRKVIAFHLSEGEVHF